MTFQFAWKPRSDLADLYVKLKPAVFENLFFHTYIKTNTKNSKDGSEKDGINDRYCWFAERRQVNIV